MAPKQCPPCDAAKVCNPKTGKCVLKTGTIGRQILGTAAPKTATGAAPKTCLPCPAIKVCNPKTGNCVLKTGTIGRQILGTAAPKAATGKAAPVVNASKSIANTNAERRAVASALAWLGKAKLSVVAFIEKLIRDAYDRRFFIFEAGIAREILQERIPRSMWPPVTAFKDIEDITFRSLYMQMLNDEELVQLLPRSDFKNGSGFLDVYWDQKLADRLVRLGYPLMNKA